MSPRRVSDTFKAGMVTDVIGAEGSVADLSDMYVRRSGELSCRGPIVYATASAANLGYHCGWSKALFHPNIGTGACRGVASASAVFRHINNSSKFQFMGGGLQLDSEIDYNPLSLSILTEGSDYAQVPLHAGVTSTVSAATGLPFERTIHMTNAGDEMVMAGEVGSLYKWGGSLYAPYNAGTVSVASASASASRIITGAGTSWSANVQEGQYILISGQAQKSNGFQRAFRITKVVSDTSLEIELSIYNESSYSGLTYRIQSLAVIESPDGVWNGTDERPRQVGIACYHQGKLFTAGVADHDTAYNTVYNFDRIRWSGTLDENANGFSHLDLWHLDAKADIFPGIGGSIRGLVSMGNELVIIKSHGLFRLTGSSTYDGTGAGLAVQVISTEVGANGFNAWEMTSRGLVIASRDGLYLYDGEEVISLTDGRVKRWWENNYPGKEYAVTQYEDKVIVTPVYFSYAAGNKLVWDSEQNLFYTFLSTNFEFVAGVSTYTEADEWVADYAFEGGTVNAATGNNQYAIPDITHFNHKKGWGQWDQRGDGVIGTEGFPAPAVLTHPFPLGDDPVSEGRVNNVIVHAAVNTTAYTGGAASADEIPVSVISGASHFGITDQWSTEEHFGDEYSLEYGIEEEHSTGGSTTDRVWRIPVDGMDPSPSARILIDANSAGYNDIGWGLRIYAIGMDVEPADVQGPTS